MESERPSRRMELLFVSGDKKCAQAVEDALRGSEESQWNVNVSCDPGEAVERLSSERYDLLLAELDLPGQNGLGLFEQALIHSPETIRAVYGSYSRIGDILRSSTLVHRFIPKFSAPRELRSSLAGLWALRERISDPALADIVAELQTLPPVPEVYSRLLDLLHRPEPSIPHIAQCVKQDPALSAKFLQLVNSAFFGLRSEVSDPGRAVSLLGLVRTRVLVCSFAIFESFRAPHDPPVSLQKLREHSLQVASLSQAFARAAGAGQEVVEASFAAGLLHDVGKLVLSCMIPDTYRHVIEGWRKGVPLVELEKALCGATHSEVGAYLLGLWGLPHALVEAALYHHEPSERKTAGFLPLTAVHVADWLAHAIELEETKAKEERELELDRGYLAEIGIDEKQLDDWTLLGRMLLGVKNLS